MTMKEFNELCSESFMNKNVWSLATSLRRNECGLPHNFVDIECFHLNMQNPPSTLTGFRLDLGNEPPTNFLWYWNASSSWAPNTTLLMVPDIPSRILSSTHRRFVIVAYQRQGLFWIKRNTSLPLIILWPCGAVVHIMVVKHVHSEHAL